VAITPATAHDHATFSAVSTDMRGQITAWNAAAEHLFGWTASEVMGRAVDPLVSDDHLAAARRAARRGDETDGHDAQWRAKDGLDVYVHVEYAPIFDADGEPAGMTVCCFENGAQQRARAALAVSESRYHSLVEALSEVVLVTNEYGRAVAPQPSWCAFTGQTATAAAALGWRNALHPHDRAVLDAQWDDRAVRRTPFAFAAQVFSRRHGEYRHCELRAAPVRDETGQVVEWVLAVADVHERVAAEREIEHLAMHDPLTDLPNRRLLLDRLTHALARCRRQGTVVGVLQCDLDRFKEVNDTHGYAHGDQLLETVAQRLRTLVREGDTVARVGGDEFLIVLEGLVDPADAARIAERVRGTIAEPHVLANCEVQVSASIGVAIGAGGVDSAEALLNRADDAMYAAKGKGRDLVEVDHEEPHAHTRRRWMERELKRALARGDLDLAFQPVVDLREGRPVGAEALLRWAPEGETVPTARVIDIAEESGLILQLTDWVLAAASEKFASWRVAHGGARGWRLHVNISARDLADPHFVERVLGAIATGGLAPSDVCLEITETAMLRHPDEAQARLAALRGAGMIVAIDDFGIGYASLGVLRDVPADIVKIDRTFVDALNHSERDRAIVQHAIELAHRLGLVVVGEGVETLAQVTILDELGCDRVQGYLFAEPCAVTELSLTL
jgi:diguanylate cyclase (GGDEF)-like protein/PAS domain S-box-containing protein